MKNFSPGSSEVSSQGQNWEAVDYPVSRQDGCCQQRRNCTQEEKLHCVSRQEFPGSQESARWGCRGAGPWGRLQGPCGWGKHTQPTYWDKPQGDRGFILHQSALPTYSIRVSMYDHVWFPPGDVSWHRQQEPRGSDEDPQLVSTAQTPLLQCENVPRCAQSILRFLLRPRARWPLFCRRRTRQPFAPPVIIPCQRGQSPSPSRTSCPTAGSRKPYLPPGTAGQLFPRKC